MTPGAPLPGVRLPDNFVARTGALEAVKGKLLAEDDRTLVECDRGFGWIGEVGVGDGDRAGWGGAGAV